MDERAPLDPDGRRPYALFDSTGGWIAGSQAALPEPLPRDHPLLKLENVTIVPHLGSATEQTRRRMAEMSVENLLAGLDGRPLPFRASLRLTVHP